MKSRTTLATGIALAAALAATLATVPVTAQASPTSATTAQRGVTVTNKCLTSVPDPGTTAPVKICYSLFQPAGATEQHRVPMIMHSHGWGGSRTTDPASFAKFLGAGYGVLSFDQRGFGESGGQAYVENPTVEGHDVRNLVRMISKLAWVKQDAKGDPRLGAIGGSYGGGYQFLGAFEELRVKGKPVFDALAPEITWFDLHESLAPDNVVRTAWASALTAAAEPTDALPQQVLTAFAEGAATGTWPDGSSPTGTNLNPFFEKNGPKWHVDHGRRLDIPVLFGQGTTDSLFPLEQGLQNWKKSITRRSRAHSIFVAYNGGHVLPAAMPQGIDVTSDPCSKKLAGGTFEDLSLRFFDEQIKHRHTGLQGYGRYHLATPDSTCTTVDSVDPTKAFPVGTVATPETGGAPLSYEIVKGPIRIAGSSYLTGTLTALGANNRAFYGLAVGTTPADAHLVQNNVLPLNEPAPVTGEERRVALPSVAIDVPAGQSLYILATPISDTFVGMGSRTPGAVILEDTVLHLPVVGG
jgi:ABC-2 type transport system ATP-binding protein